MVVSVSFLFSDFLLGTIVGNLLFRDVASDAREMERAVRESGLAWTIVRPPQLTNGARTEHYRVKSEHLPPRGFSISRADLAHFMLSQPVPVKLIGRIAKFRAEEVAEREKAKAATPKKR